ncbi:MAG: metallophosphoesterase [Candidatus Eremiobacter antarcticus]|nr:metallophosphoesterase family protein [Candidatus Eremiobacteraeota bacterium]MBC5807393.1 metallophosphoesterase family protein [Candidatus Eremiobacteraeota bacterium]PZR63144.1 MAG: metallophosphoesterase [Candidatus Eremiobacter sp. RRmetagenome_bin22]
MRYGIISDVHSNLDALQPVLEELDRKGMDQLLCLGDIVGYGPNPNECCELLRARHCLAIGGNHDEAALSPVQADAFNSLAREAIAWTNRELSPDNREFLVGLPRERSFPGFVIVHGAPVFHFAYILSVLDAESSFERVSAPLTFIGHTHLAEVYYQNDQGRTFHRKLTSGGVVKLEPSYRYILNPGSVGQPRDHNPQASFAYFDDETESVEVLRISYDVMKVRRRMRTANLPAELAERLSIGY